MALGLIVCGAAIGVVPSKPGSLHAPRWVLFLCGAMFLGAGIGVVRGSRTFRIIARLLVAALGTVGLWIAFQGDAAQFAGHVPLLDAAQSVTAMRWTFGVVGALCLATAAAMLVTGGRNGSEPHRQD